MISSFVPRLLLVTALSVCAIAGAQAQATRTWVSGTGDDANPCSRTAPCKTFAGAISKTAVAGEINVIDAGGFGAVTITKSITISSEGTEAGVLVSGTNAIVINAGPNDRVVLRNLDLEGIGSGIDAVRVLRAGHVTVERCIIHGFTAQGIDIIPTATARVSVVGCHLRELGGVGILIKPSGGTAAAFVADTTVTDCVTGLRAETNGFADISHSSFTTNSANGIVAVNGGVITAADSVCSENAGGIYASSGTIRIANMIVSNNSLHGLLPATANSILSFGDNKVAGNNPDNAPSATIPLK